MLSILLQCAAIIFTYMSSVFLIAQLKKDNSFADIAWGIGYILIAIYTLIKTGLFYAPHLLITSMIVMWGLRLSIHIYLRNKGKGEDSRYKKWREEWGKWATLRSYLQVFILQGLILLIVVYPVILINTSMVNSIGVLHVVG